MGNINIHLGHISVDECTQSPEIRDIEIIVETNPPIIFNLSEPEECTTYQFNREQGEPENLIQKTIVIDSYRVTECSQCPLIESICGNMVLRFSNGVVKNLSFDLTEED